MKRALGEFIIEGVKTTIPFHQSVLSKRAFLRGNVTTSFIRNNKILDEVKHYLPDKKKQLTKEQKVILVTTAISKYVEKRSEHANDKPNQWVIANRQELMNEESQ